MVLRVWGYEEVALPSIVEPRLFLSPDNMNDRTAKGRWYPKPFQYQYTSSVLRYGTVMSLGKPRPITVDAHPK